MKIWLPWALLVLPATCQQSLRLPPCSLNCVAQAIPISVCDPSMDLTCICAKPDLYYELEGCLASSCSPTEGIAFGTIDAKTCNRPQRSRKGELFIPLVVVIPAFICVLLRLYSRRMAMGRFELDDYVMMLCGLSYVGSHVVGQYEGAIAFGVDIWNVRPEDLTLGLKLLYIGESFYIATLSLAKVSILLFYVRIFPNPRFRLAAYVTMGFVILTGVTVLFVLIFQCIPIHHNWEGWKGDSGPHKCVDLSLLVYAAASLNIVQEALILALPLPILYRLKSSTRSKINVLILFSLGIFILESPRRRPSTLRLPSTTQSSRHIWVATGRQSTGPSSVQPSFT